MFIIVVGHYISVSYILKHHPFASSFTNYFLSMPFSFKVIQIILSVGVLQSFEIGFLNTSSFKTVGNDKVTSLPTSQPESKSDIQRDEQMELARNNSAMEDEVEQGEFCVKMKPLHDGDKLSERQMAALGCLFEYVMVPSSPDASGLSKCLSQAGRYI